MNWYTYSLDELLVRKQKLLEWVMENPTHEKAKKSWQVIGEITEVIENKRQGKQDQLVGEVLETLF